MRSNLVVVLSAFFVFFLGSCFPALAVPKQKAMSDDSVIDQGCLIPVALIEYHKIKAKPLTKIEKMLNEQTTNLDEEVATKVLMTLKCARKFDLAHNNILTVIDYSLPSNEKRLWVFDLMKNKLLFYTYVSHAIKSGLLMSKYFSNKVNSKHSSIGVYSTDKSYRGRYGLALKLYGLDRSFNDNAYRRFIVMHGAWYVKENFIKRYGRAGRSWGCPAIPPKMTQPIINTIKDKSLFVVYYPSKYWFLKSKFLNCENLSIAQNLKDLKIDTKRDESTIKSRDTIVFADINNNNKREVNEPIVAMSTDDYQRTFNKKVKLRRMLRRQINNMEYIALSNTEFKQIISTHAEPLKIVNFIIPVVKMKRGYYATEMKIISLGKVKNIQLHANTEKQTEIHKVHLEKKPAVTLRLTNRFIRWLGL